MGERKERGSVPVVWGEKEGGSDNDDASERFGHERFGVGGREMVKVVVVVVDDHKGNGKPPVQRKGRNLSFLRSRSRYLRPT